MTTQTTYASVSIVGYTNETKRMKLNKKTKIAVVLLVVAAVVDMWRGWPWAKSLIKKAKSEWNGLASLFTAPDSGEK